MNVMSPECVVACEGADSGFWNAPSCREGDYKNKRKPKLPFVDRFMIFGCRKAVIYFLEMTVAGTS
jgi:hypothetical protein